MDVNDRVDMSGRKGTVVSTDDSWWNHTYPKYICVKWDKGHPHETWEPESALSIVYLCEITPLKLA